MKSKVIESQKVTVTFQTFWPYLNLCFTFLQTTFVFVLSLNSIAYISHKLKWPTIWHWKSLDICLFFEYYNYIHNWPIVNNFLYKSHHMQKTKKRLWFLWERHTFLKCGAFCWWELGYFDYNYLAGKEDGSSSGETNQIQQRLNESLKRNEDLETTLESFELDNENLSRQLKLLETISGIFHLYSKKN